MIQEKGDFMSFWVILTLTLGHNFFSASRRGKNVKKSYQIKSLKNLYFSLVLTQIFATK
jgi:hypothetical protein